MKTLVIQLDSSEDTGSIRDKVSWGKASRVLLVWPVNYSLFDRKVDLVTIKRICSSQGSRLGIVCDDPVVCAEADDLQIPVFDSVNRAMRKGWDRRKHRRIPVLRDEDLSEKPTVEELRTHPVLQREDHPISALMRRVLFTVGIIAVLALILYLVPSATVRLYPVSQNEELTVEFQVDSREGGAENPGILHGTVVNVTIEGKASKAVTGTSSVPDKKAKGTVSFTNQTNKEVIIPARTLVTNNTNPPVRYYVLKDIRIPPDETVSGIEIEAVYGGESGNSPANAITRIDGEVGLQVQLTNSEPVSGGTDKTIPAPSNEDAIALRADLQQKLAIEAQKQLSAGLKSDEILLPVSIKAGELISEEMTPTIGQAGTTATMRQKVEFSALVIHHSSLTAHAEELLAANRLLPGWMISNREMVEVQIVDQTFDHVSNTVKMRTQIKGQMIPKVNTDSIRHNIVGLSRRSALSAISLQMLSKQPPEIETWPVWLPLLPWLETRINVVVP